MRRPATPGPPRRRLKRLLALALSTVLVMVASWMVATPAFAASTLGLEKEASVDEASPGEDFKYTLTPRCSGLTESCINAVLTDVVPTGVEITALPPSTPEYTVAFDAGTRTLTVTFLIPLTAPSPAGSVGLPAGSSRNIELGVKIPDNSQTPDGTVITNNGLLKADNAPEATASAPVTVDVPRVVTPVATKTWSDGSAVAHSDEAGIITLGARNASSSTAQVSELVVEDSTPAVFEHFDVTGVGPVTFPAGADRVTVLACTVVLSACTGADYGTGTPQTGPALTLPVPAADVTGLRFVFTSSTGAVLPYDPTGGSVQVGTVLRDTVRSTGADYSPTVRDDISNCATPSAVDPVLGTVSAVQACVPYSVQPAQATIAMTKSYFSDTNGDYTADGQAVIGLNSLVSGVVTSRNTSPFPVSTITIREPSAIAPSEFSKLDLTRSRIVFPSGATAAEVVIKCDDTDSRTLNFTPADSPVNVPTPCPSGIAAGVSVTFTGTIAQNAVATLGVQGRLNDQVTDADLSDGVSNCADGTATGDGIGSASSNVCATVPVRAAFAQLNGVKTSQLPTILPGLPRQFNLSFKNNGTIPATGVVLADPADPTASPNAFSSIRLSSLTLPATPVGTAELYDPIANAYVPYNAADSALLTRATGFRVTVASVAAGQSYALTAQVLLRDGVLEGTAIQNCASIGSDTQPPTPFCAPQITVLAQSSGASVQKSISPASSVRPQPGLPGANIQVKFATQNTGTLWLKQLSVIDVDTAFFDAVDVRPTDPIRVNFPPSANRVRVDACTGACGDTDFVTGTVSASQSPPLPIPAADVRGLRITFLTADGSFTIKPGTNFPATGLCSGASICVNVSPRVDLRSAPGTPVPTELSDTATGKYESTQQNGTPADISPTTATHLLTDGSAALRFAKGSDISVSPGTPIPVTLTATNTGTGVIPEPQIVDPIPAQLEFSPNDPANPFSVAYTLPANAPPPADPVFTAISDSSGKVTSVRVEWPGWDMVPGTVATVTIQLKLAPGNTAGSVIENRAGATGNRPDLSCAPGGPRPGTATDDPTYGDGTYCTSAAQVTTLAGNAFRTEKWVAGDVTLGWLNSLTGELIPLGDPGCPRLDVDGQMFTRYPCVARVAPGQGFDFYLRLTNAGTNPATEVRVVDVFPAPRDTGVILTGEQRGTEWQQAPTLLGPVTLAGPGNLTASYTDVKLPDPPPDPPVPPVPPVSPYCTTDLNRPPVNCAPQDWPLAQYTPTATAFRSIVTFPGQLAPGASTALRFRMAAPPAPTDPAQNEIAWNSFAHTEFFQDTGRIVQLPPTEPIKTGVALVYGGLSITKVVVGDPSAEQAGPYGFHYECSVTPEVATGAPAATPVIAASGTIVLAAGETGTIANVPARAQCLVWEPDSDGLISDAADRATAKQVVIPVDGSSDVPAEVTVTNTVPLVEPPTTEPTAPPTDPTTTSPTQMSTQTPPSTATSTVTVYPGQNGGGGYYEVSDGKGGTLSYTGVDVAGLLTMAALLIMAGGAAVVVARRRRYRGTH